ncbi:MAG: Na+/H+ antiporter NhaC family protein [Candidatus Krumholzibacteriota bacterium]|nr:Na+/H+ antiporter NhaC family protein [Candidatus Krumholzibacteriota bacterium]
MKIHPDLKARRRLSICTVVLILMISTIIVASPRVFSREQSGRDIDAVVLKGIPWKWHPSEDLLNSLDSDDGTAALFIDEAFIENVKIDSLSYAGIILAFEKAGIKQVRLVSGDSEITGYFRSISGLLAILPPIIAIVFALVFKQVVIALLSGVWLGSLVFTGYHPIGSIMRIVDHYVINTLAGTAEGIDHMSIVIFTLLLGGMVGITSRMGGMQGIVRTISKLATNPRRGQLTVWLMGVIIFFDDYTNTLIVGNSTRPLTDRLRISREKLSYIVDSTAAPITSLAVITSWIGFQISLINQSFTAMQIDRNPLATFVSSLPYSIYPILAILFVLFIILSGRDYSLMLKAERRARTTGKVNSDSAVPLSSIDSEKIALADGVTPRIVNGIIPISAVIIVTFIGLLITGRDSLRSSGVDSYTILEMLKESNSFVAILWSSFTGCIIAAAMALSQRLLSLTETVSAWVDGIKSMVMAFIILILAWCIGSVCVELHTADYLVHHLASFLSPDFLPMIIFLLAMGISFSTGTSWGTMSILTPIVIPLVYGTASASGLDAASTEPILLASIAAILSGAVFGDHCSPISDTTIMSSMASGADHIDHVRTQLPYALTVGAIALVGGYLPVALGVPVLLSLALSILSMAAVLRIFGRTVQAGNDSNTSNDLN